MSLLSLIHFDPAENELSGGEIQIDFWWVLTIWCDDSATIELSKSGATLSARNRRETLMFFHHWNLLQML